MVKNERYKYMVATRCMTYNHAPYIEETLQGFVLQETTFPVVYIVMDDASIDGEQEVLRKWTAKNLQPESAFWKQMPYGELVVSSLKEKPMSLFVVVLLNENHYQKKQIIRKFDYIKEWLDDAKYYAICEGDDYWTEPHKLQMQVEFMEAHPDYVLCHTDFNLTTGKARNHNAPQTPDDIYFPLSVKKDLEIGTLTTLTRATVVNHLPKLWVGKGWPMGDLQNWIELSHEGKFKRFPIVTANYRILPHSASHGSMEKEIRFISAIREVKMFYAGYYGVELENDGYSPAYYVDLIKIAFKHQKQELAEKYKKEAIEKKMTSRRMWFYYYATKIPPFGHALRKYLGR